MKYSREYILRRAFDVFMTKGYDSASISVLQKELDMSRGAMYRYFKNKEELFNSVIDEYVINLFGRLLQRVDEDILLSQLIELVHRRQKLVISVFTRAGINQAVFLNYTALMIQAAKHYPNFDVRFHEIHQKLKNNWKLAIKNSVKAGEVKQDVNIDILSVLFNNAGIRESSEEKYDENNFKCNITCDIGRRKEVMDYLFSLIKA
jgi:Transcriptional regulator